MGECLRAVRGGVDEDLALHPWICQPKNNNSRHWDAARFASEIRPIIGWHLRPVDIIFNPIVDTAYDGLKNLDFAPVTRVAHNVSPEWTFALEEYGDYGPLRRFHPLNEQSHQLYFVVNHDNKFMQIEAGAGVGMTAGSDKLTLKLIPVTRSEPSEDAMIDYRIRRG